MKRRVFVIGLDGATLDLIQPWTEAGILPNLNHLIQGGISGRLTSTYPPLTGPAWSSFMTGKSPGQHGVLEFFRRKDGTYRQVLNNRLDIDGKSLWGYISDRNLRVGVIGVPLTYPPEPVNGFLITGLLTPPGRRDFTYPVDLLEELEAQLGEYRLRHDETYRRNNPYPFLKEQYEILENNIQVAHYLMTHKDWDFFMLHILGTDRFQHEFWHLLDPKHPDHDPVELEKIGNVVQDYFERVDAAIGRLLEVLDEETVIIIMSDHGFGPVYKFINFNTWLLKEGLLRLKNTPATWMRYLLFRLGFNYTVLGNWILKLGFGRMMKELGRAKREDWQRRVFLSLNDVDWHRSKVYSIGNFGQLYVNLRGREPYGIVAPGEEYEAVVNDLTDRLKSMVDPQTGDSVVEKILRREQIYHGPYTEQSPDLMFFTRNMEYKAMGLSDFSSHKVFEPIFGTRGHHRMDGVLICYGPGVIKTNAKVSEACIFDLAPSILYLMDQEIPSEMDGRVLTELFTDEFNSMRTIQYWEGGETASDLQQTVLSEQEETVLSEMLRSLGYVN